MQLLVRVQTLGHELINSHYSACPAFVPEQAERCRQPHGIQAFPTHSGANSAAPGGFDREPDPIILTHILTKTLLGPKPIIHYQIELTDCFKVIKYCYVIYVFLNVCIIARKIDLNSIHLQSYRPRRLNYEAILLYGKHCFQENV